MKRPWQRVYAVALTWLGISIFAGAMSALAILRGEWGGENGAIGWGLASIAFGVLSALEWRKAR